MGNKKAVLFVFGTALFRFKVLNKFINTYLLGLIIRVKLTRINISPAIRPTLIGSPKNSTPEIKLKTGTMSVTKEVLILPALDIS